MVFDGITTAGDFAEVGNVDFGTDCARIEKYIVAGITTGSVK